MPTQVKLAIACCFSLVALVSCTNETVQLPSFPTFARANSSSLSLGHKWKVEIWLDRYISCYICFTKLNFSLIIKLDVLPCLINILSWPGDMSRDHFVKLGESANWWRMFGLLINKWAFSMQSEIQQFSIFGAVGLFRSDMLLIVNMVWPWFSCGTVCVCPRLSRQRHDILDFSYCPLSRVCMFACDIGRLAKIWIWVSSEVITICI